MDSGERLDLDPNVATLALPHSGTSLRWHYNSRERRDVSPVFMNISVHSPFFVFPGKALEHTSFCGYLEHAARLVPIGPRNPHKPYDHP